MRHRYVPAFRADPTSVVNAVARSSSEGIYNKAINPYFISLRRSEICRARARAQRGGADKWRGITAGL
jgi:hypothetical protein